jgi:hypothetical protein
LTYGATVTQIRRRETPSNHAVVFLILLELIVGLPKLWWSERAMSGASIANIQLVERLATALAVGLLFVLERGWERRELLEGQRSAGFRTFGIIGLLGGSATKK